MNKHELTHILHGEGYMYRLSFKFSSNTTSPKLGTYACDPDDEKSVPTLTDIASIQFDSRKD